jgi:hypothetical protein
MARLPNLRFPAGASGLLLCLLSVPLRTTRHEQPARRSCTRHAGGRPDQGAVVVVRHHTMASLACPIWCLTAAQVVVTPWRGFGVPDFAEFGHRRALLWQHRKWARGVLVDSSEPPPAVGGAPPSALPLHVRLQRLTAHACRVCDPAGCRPFPTDKLLKLHLQQAHGLRLCDVCLKVH